MGGLCRARLTFVGALTSVWVGLLPPAVDMAEIQPSRTSVPESYSFQILLPRPPRPPFPPSSSSHPFCPLSHLSSQSPTAAPRPALVATIQLFVSSPPSSSACPPSPPSHLSERPPRRSSAGPPHAHRGAPRHSPLPVSHLGEVVGTHRDVRVEVESARTREDERVRGGACTIDGVC